MFYRDVNPVVQISLQLWLYLTPVAYPLSAVPERYRPFFLLNPLTGDCRRDARRRSSSAVQPDWRASLGISAALIVDVFVAASDRVFKRTDKYFADVI